MRMTVRTIAALWLALLVACATVTPEQGAREAVAAGYVAVETVATTTEQLRVAGRASSEHVAQVKAHLQAALIALDTARELLRVQRYVEARIKAEAVARDLQGVTP